MTIRNWRGIWALTVSRSPTRCFGWSESLPCQSPGVESVRTVGDMIMAACGGASAESTDVQIGAPPAGWLSSAGDCAGANSRMAAAFQQVFLAQARRNPDQVIAADLQQGSRTYRDLITAILALRPKIAAASRAIRRDHAARLCRRRHRFLCHAFCRQDAGDDQLDGRIRASFSSGLIWWGYRKY